MARYFKRFPLVNYDGTPAKNILARVDFTDEAKRDIYSNFDYVIQEGTSRPDILSFNYYNSAQYDWLIYMTNNIVDPYHDYYKSEDDFKSFIKAKYGSLDIAQQKILYYRNNWAPDESLISEVVYDALDPAYKKYWKPRLNATNTIVGYERVKEDWIVSTNRIVQITLSVDVSAFETDDIIVQSSNNARGILVSSIPETNSLILQHISGEFEVNPADAITAVTVLKENISTEEEAFWAPVSAYSYEEEQNELKKYINMIKASYLSDVEKLFIEQLKK
jgi:hypothetical protein